MRNDTARLQADNLALQTVLLPRRVGSIGINEPPKAVAWFAGMERFTNTEFVIQPTVGDAEALNLANEIKVVLYLFGLKATVDENRTTSPQLPDGISVSYPTGRAWTADAPNQPWFEWHDAAEALANALTRAGLGVGDGPVSRYGFTPRSPSEGLHFNPVTQGVLVLVGSRPEYTKANLQTELVETLKDMEWCRLIRNQYAHCHWYWTQQEGLCFVNLEELAEQPSEILELMSNRHPIDVPLLYAQESFLNYVKESFTHLASAYRAWNQRRSALRPSIHVFAKPSKLARPLLHN